MVVRLGRKGGSEHGVLASAEALRAALDAAPTTIFVTDSDGEIVYRNAEANQTLKAAVDELGEEGLVRLRSEMQRIMRTGRSFPSREDVQVGHDDRELFAHVNIARIPNGFVVNWYNSTSAAERATRIHELADEVGASGRSLAQLGDQLAAASTSASEQAESLSLGAGELTGSIGEISSGAAAAASSTRYRRPLDRGGDRQRREAEQLERRGRHDQPAHHLDRRTDEPSRAERPLEAARAGEAGRGFAVVAAEVKELSRRTADATAQITTMIEAIQADSGEATGAIGRIVDLIADIEAQQTVIAGAVEEQSATASAMAQGVEALASATGSTAGAVESLRTAAIRLADSASELRSLVSLS